MKLTISGQQVEVKEVADFLSQMGMGVNDNGKYENLILESPEKQAWISENFKIVQRPLPSRRTHLDVDLGAAFSVIEG